MLGGGGGGGGGGAVVVGVGVVVVVVVVVAVFFCQCCFFFAAAAVFVCLLACLFRSAKQTPAASSTGVSALLSAFPGTRSNEGTGSALGRHALPLLGACP